MNLPAFTNFADALSWCLANDSADLQRQLRQRTTPLIDALPDDRLNDAANAYMAFQFAKLVALPSFIERQEYLGRCIAIQMEQIEAIKKERTPETVGDILRKQDALRQHNHQYRAFRKWRQDMVDGAARDAVEGSAA